MRRQHVVEKSNQPMKCVGCIRQRRRSTAAIVACWLILLPFIVACEGEDGAELRRPNLILILLDTVRRDHIGSYGYHRDTTPVIDSLARDGIVFERAVAQSSWTLPSFGSLMTSRYPREIFPEGATPIPAGNVYTFAEALRNGGYRTISVTTNPYNFDVFRLMQGFEFPNQLYLAPADRVVARAIEEIDRAIDGDGRGGGIPYFLFLHFMDNHFPLTVPSPYDTHFPTLDGLPHDESARVSLGYGVPEEAQGEAFENYRSHTLSLYDGSLYFTDSQLGRLFDHLRERRVFENSVIVVASDHGEAFWDHGKEEKELGLKNFLRPDVFGLGHGHTLFPELIRVPLIVSGRGVPRGRVSSQVRNLDIAPTLLSVTAIDDPEFVGRGVSLLAHIADGTPADLPAFSETVAGARGQWAYWDGRHRYLRIGERELLFGDKESGLTDIAAGEPETLVRLRRELDALLSSAKRPAKSRDTELPEETLDHLRELGYIE
jgi:arylsulfatase A-like enzyme